MLNCKDCRVNSCTPWSEHVTGTLGWVFSLSRWQFCSCQSWWCSRFHSLPWWLFCQLGPGLAERHCTRVFCARDPKGTVCSKLPKRGRGLLRQCQWCPTHQQLVHGLPPWVEVQLLLLLSLLIQHLESFCEHIGHQQGKNSSQVYPLSTLHFLPPVLYCWCLPRHTLRKQRWLRNKNNNKNKTNKKLFI